MHLSRLAIGSSIYAAFAVKIYHCMTGACMLYTTILSCKEAHKPVKIIALKPMKIYLYGTIGHPIRVWASHMSIRIWDIPYAYGTTYAYRAEHNYLNDCLQRVKYDNSYSEWGVFCVAFRRAVHWGHFCF